LGTVCADKHSINPKIAEALLKRRRLLVAACLLRRHGKDLSMTLHFPFINHQQKKKPKPNNNNISEMKFPSKSLATHAILWFEEFFSIMRKRTHGKRFHSQFCCHTATLMMIIINLLQT